MDLKKKNPQLVLLGVGWGKHSKKPAPCHLYSTQTCMFFENSDIHDGSLRQSLCPTTEKDGNDKLQTELTFANL